MVYPKWTASGPIHVKAHHPQKTRVYINLDVVRSVCDGVRADPEYNYRAEEGCPHSGLCGRALS